MMEKERAEARQCNQQSADELAGAQNAAEAREEALQAALARAKEKHSAALELLQAEHALALNALGTHRQHAEVRSYDCLL